MNLQAGMEVDLDASEVNKSIAIPDSIHYYNASKCMKFDPIWVQVLINLRMKHSKMFTRRRNSASEGWKLVFEELKDTGVPEYVTINKIKKKWMNLMTRYRQIKNTTLNPDTITWPYFEQMNNAFGKDQDMDEESKMDTSLNQSISNDEKQNFIKRLIELRHSHRHLFTGRKYTARDGWMIIQSLLHCQDKYSIDQLSKCWQNLVQRYKQLAKGEADNITWPYYESMQKWFNEDKSENPIEMAEAKKSITDGETKQEPADLKTTHATQTTQKLNISIDCIKIQLLTELRASQEKHHGEVMGALNNIRNSLNKSIPVQSIEVIESENAFG